MRRILPISVTILTICSIVSAEVKKDISRKAEPQVEVLQKAKKFGFPRAHKSPRPTPNQTHVPLQTSFSIQLVLKNGVPGDVVVTNSVAVTLTPDGGKSIDVIKNGQVVTPGFDGRIKSTKPSTLSIYASPAKPLKPATTYTVSVSAQSKNGLTLSPKTGAWSFTTADPRKLTPVDISLDLSKEPVRWHGTFFSGFCQAAFNTSVTYDRMDGYKMMHEAHKRHPKAWSVHRDFMLTGMASPGGDYLHFLPGLVREQETRRISSMKRQEDGVLLQVEDFFGHQQYGIKSNRPLSPDYKPGNEILVADGKNHATAKVVAVDDKARTVLVSNFDDPKAGWKIKYYGQLPENNPKAPGLFPPGGCYLRKFKPSGTACYYWGRVDMEWELSRKYDKKRVVSFSVPAALTVTGREWDAPKDYAQYHEVMRAITDRLIKKYGDFSKDCFWSIHNEPDLSASFWRASWEELQVTYDYTADAILRAFEDNGYDSEHVFVGGLELGAIAGTQLKIREFLAHCSPRAELEGAVSLNAAYVDPKLKGKRSRRVEQLCEEYKGKGSPIDFISVHSYDTSELMAKKLTKAKQDALELDSEYYGKLWVCSHESCPAWFSPTDDPAWSHSYRGNGFYSSWMADVTRRLLESAKKDSRYGYGQTILTEWAWVDGNIRGANACTSLLKVDVDGDEKPDKSVTIKKQNFHFQELLASMGDEYFMLPEVERGGHVVSGFATTSKQDTRVLLYTHNEYDTQSRSDAVVDVRLKLAGLPGKKVVARQYRLDKNNNSYYDFATEKVKAFEKGAAQVFTPKEAAKVKELSNLRETGKAREVKVKDGSIDLPVKVAANGVTFLVLE